MSFVVTEVSIIGVDSPWALALVFPGRHVCGGSPLNAATRSNAIISFGRNDRRIGRSHQQQNKKTTSSLFSTRTGCFRVHSLQLRQSTEPLASLGRGAGMLSKLI